MSAKEVLAKVCRVVGTIYLFIAGGIILLSLAMVYLKEGAHAVAEILSPYNIPNFIVTIVTLAPGLFLMWLADKLEGLN